MGPNARAHRLTGFKMAMGKVIRDNVIDIELQGDIRVNNDYYNVNLVYLYRI